MKTTTPNQDLWHKLAMCLFIFIALSFIMSKAYLGISGAHTFRQGHVLGHILGFIGFKGMQPYDVFLNNAAAVFDFPLYQFVIAKISQAFGSDPLLVTRYVNCMIWLAMAYSGYRLAEFFGSRWSGLLCVFAFATSPLIMHYSAVPLPDMFAVTLSAFGVLFLLQGGLSQKSVLVSLPFWLLAALIKSPIPFVFVVFYGVYLIATNDWRKHGLIGSAIRHRILLFLFVPLLIFALGAEYVRSLVDAGLTGSNEYDNRTWQISWYFGDMGLRLSPEYGLRILERFNEMFDLPFLYVYGLFTALSLFIDRARPHVSLIIGALCAYLVGWLVFANVYFVHDYYQLPAAFLLLLSFSVSASIVVRYILSKLPSAASDVGHKAAVCAIGVFAIGLAATPNPKGHEPSAFFNKGVEYILRDTDVILYVVDKSRGNPAYGGRYLTRFEPMFISQFEFECDNFIKAYDVIISSVFSPCLAKNRPNASVYIEDNGIHFFRSSRPNAENITVNKDAIINITSEVFDVHYVNGIIHYSRTNCTPADTAPTFFLHIIPRDPNTLPQNAAGGFVNRDFIFKNVGSVDANTCVASQNIGALDPAVISTGQYDKTGRVWEASAVIP